MNKRIMERFTSEFLPTGDPALARKFISPDIVMHFGGRTQQGRDTYLGIVAANMKAFPDLRWTVEDMRAEGDTVAIRYTMTGTHKDRSPASRQRAGPSARRAWRSTAWPTARSSRSAPSSTC